MAWGKLDDGFDDHPKVVEILDQLEAPMAIAVWTLCLSWANRNTRKAKKVPGVLPLGLPRRFFGQQAQGGVKLLISVGLWHEGVHDCPRCPQAEGGGYVIHDFKDSMPSDDLRSARAEAGRRGAAARWGRQKASKLSSHASNLPSFGDNTDAFANGTPMANDGPEGGFGTWTGQPAGSPSTDGNLPCAEPSGSSNGHGNLPSEAGNGLASDAYTPTHTQKPIPPTAGTTPPRQDGDPARHVGNVVGAYVDGARAAGQPDPASSLRARVGKQARALLVDGFDLDTLVASARNLGAGEWNDLAVQVRKDAATAAGAGSPAGPQARRQQETNEWLGRAMGRAREQEAAEAAAIAGGTA